MLLQMNSRPTCRRSSGPARGIVAGGVPPIITIDIASMFARITHSDGREDRVTGGCCRITRASSGSHPPFRSGPGVLHDNEDKAIARQPRRRDRHNSLGALFLVRNCELVVSAALRSAKETHAADSVVGHSQKSACAFHDLLQSAHIFVRGGGLSPLLRVQLDADGADEFHAIVLEGLLNGGEGFAIRPGYLSLTLNPFDSEKWDGCLDCKRACCPSQQCSRGSNLCARNHRRPRLTR
jgi:hypothetical protein